MALIGRNTLIIMCLHILAFKFIGLFQIHLLGFEYNGNLRLWGNVETDGFWAYIYCGLGIAISLGVEKNN